jgi:hypothetical protein
MRSAECRSGARSAVHGARCVVRSEAGSGKREAGSGMRPEAAKRRVRCRITSPRRFTDTSRATGLPAGPPPATRGGRRTDTWDRVI